MKKPNLAAIGAAAALLLAACGSDSKKSTPDDGCPTCLYHTLVWADEFDGTGQPDPLNWSYNVGAGYNKGAGMFLGWGNWEKEWYRPENAVQADGNLVITADYDAARTAVGGWDTKIRSARLVSQGKVSFGPARFEARIKMPSVVGTWPAFWLMGDAIDSTYTTDYAAAADYYDFMASYWPAAGEIDVMEHINDAQTLTENLFWDTRSELQTWNGDTIADDPSTYDPGTFDVTQFHTYAVEWDATSMYWYVDGARVKTKDISAANMEEYAAGRNFFILLNLAIGGQFPGAEPQVSDFPLQMSVDYVRVYQ